MRACRTCGCDVQRHRRKDRMRLCPVRPLSKDERKARDLSPEPLDGDAARYIVDRSLLTPEKAPA